MKICLVSHSFLPTIGGAELVVHHLATYFSKVGHEVVVFTHKKNKKANFRVDYRIAYYPRTPEKYVRFLQGYIFMIFLLSLNRREKFDLIHVHVAKMAFYALKLKKFIGTPIIATTHGGDIQKYPSINYGARLDPFWSSKIEYAIRNADLLTSIGSSTRREYKAIGARSANIVDIPNGVDCKRFESDYEDVRVKLNLDPGAKLLLSVGRYHPKKGYEYLVEAMPEIAKNCENVKCLLVGKRLDTLKPLIEKKGIQNSILLVEEQAFNPGSNSAIDLKKMPNDFLYNIYRSSDLYISPSLIEGFALTIIEAMAAGLPIVATQVEGNEDAVKNGQNGLFIPPKNPEALAKCVIELVNNDARRAVYAKKSKEMSEKYDWMDIAHAYLSEYRNLKEKYA